MFGALPASACALSAQGAAGADRIVRYGYTNADQVSTVTSGYASAAPIVEATTTYTNNGLAASVADGAGNATTFVYDGFDRLSRQRYPNASGGGSSASDYEEYAYDAGGNVISMRRRDGATIASVYDALNRVVSMTPSANGAATNYTYDLFSRPLSAVSAGRTVTQAYDQLSRLTSSAGPQGTVSYQWDAAGRRTRVTWPDAFFVVYDYDLTGAVTAIRENGAVSGAGVLATYAYDNLGRRTGVARGNGTSESASYDALSRLATLAQNLAGTAQDVTFTYGVNAAGAIASRASSNALYNAPVPFNGTTAYADNGLNQYTSVAGSAPSYDTRGNLTAFAGSSYGYDIFNRMISATPAGGSAATLAYDPAGRLHEIANPSATTRFLYDGAQMIAEYNASNVLQRRYVFGPGLDEPIVWYEGSGTADRQHLVQDERGSVLAVTNASGTATTINAYDEFGQRGASNTGRFQFTGQMWLQEAGIYHYRARAYVPSLGRFAQTDPIGFAGGMNIYAYVANDPINFVDPWGLDAECWGEYPDVVCRWVETPEWRDYLDSLNDRDIAGNWLDRLDRDGDGLISEFENTVEAKRCARSAQHLANINATLAGLNQQIRTINDARNISTGAATTDMALRHFDTLMGGAVQRDLRMEAGRGLPTDDSRRSRDDLSRARAASALGRIAGTFTVSQFYGAGASVFSKAESRLAAERARLSAARLAAGCVGA